MSVEKRCAIMIHFSEFLNEYKVQNIIYIFSNIINVFTIIFDHFNASLLNLKSY